MKWLFSKNPATFEARIKTGMKGSHELSVFSLRAPSDNLWSQLLADIRRRKAEKQKAI